MDIRFHSMHADRIYVCVNTYKHMCMYVCMYVCMHACMYVGMHARTHARMHAYMCVLYKSECRAWCVSCVML